MPRGVYDRSKTKAQRASEKKEATAVSAAPATKKAAGAKRGPKPGTKRKTASAVTAQNTVGANSFTASVANNDHPYFAFHEIRSNLATLNELSGKFGDIAMIREEVEANIGIMGMLREKHFPTKDDETVQAQPQQVATANGTSTGSGYAAPSIPLPPTPVIPTPHS